MREFRLLPIFVLCAGALLLLKLSGLAILGHYALPLSLTGVAPALAQTEQPPAEAAMQEPEQPVAPPNDSMGAATAPDPAAGEARPANDVASDGTPGRLIKPGEDTGARAAVLERLGERRDALDKREREMDMRDKLLNAAEARIAARVNELKEIEARITAAVEKRDAEKKAQLKGLVTMYETMKPKDAARIFSELNLDVLVDVVEQMNARKMAEVLANMDVKAAERLTLALAAKSREKSFPAVTQELPKIEGKPQSSPQG